MIKCANIFASMLARIINERKQILVIDLDPQGNLTQCFKLEIDKPWAVNLFNDKDNNITDLIFKTNFKNVNTIPTDIEMSELEIKLSSQFGREQKLKNTIQKNISFLQENYDYILIDTNPSLNVTNVNAYLSADKIVLISDNSIHSWRAIGTINKQWNNIINYINAKNNISAIVLNNFDTYTISKDFIDNLKDSSLNNFLVHQEIRKKQVFKASEITGTPVIKTLKKEKNPYFNIVDELEQKGVI
jgi:chromosome partitioning protein